MSLARLGAVLVAVGLSGCEATERTISALVPDQFLRLPALGLMSVQQNHATEQTVASRPKESKAPKPERVAVAPTDLNLPPWSVPAAKPTTTLRYTLPPSELFRHLSPSVYTVAVSGPQERQGTQGSAVAISTREAVTNCHVVSQGRAIALINGTENLKPEVIAADLTTDRCFLRAEGELQPVAGLRDYDSIMVGETIYTIGSPKGLVNSLGSGLLAGLRKSEDGADYVQITARSPQAHPAAGYSMIAAIWSASQPSRSEIRRT